MYKYFGLLICFGCGLILHAAGIPWPMIFVPPVFGIGLYAYLEGVFTRSSGRNRPYIGLLGCFVCSLLLYTAGLPWSVLSIWPPAIGFGLVYLEGGFSRADDRKRPPLR